MLHTVLAGSVRPVARPWMIVLTDVRVLGPRDAPVRQTSDPVVSALVSQGIPVVLVSPGAPSEVRTLQAALGIRTPFISAGGAELHVPGGYFDEMLGLGQRSEDWSVIQFSVEDRTPGFSKAIELLLLLYWSHRRDGMVVGVSDREHSILGQADVPILVRNPHVDQAVLRAQLPEMYCTSATGPAGWAEGILGPVEL